MKNRIVFVGTPINDIVANLIVAQLLYLAQEDPEREMAASMGAVLLAGGARGKRRALPNSRILIHQASGGFEGTASGTGVPSNGTS